MAQASACAPTITQPTYGTITVGLTTRCYKDPFIMPFHWYGIFTALVPVAVQFVLFLRWLHRRMRNDEITRTFVRDIATNHLPHIYSALRQIAEEQGIKLEEPPLLHFVDLSGRRRF